MKKQKKVQPMGMLITRGEWVANTKANNERIAEVILRYEERLRKLEAVVFPQSEGLSLVKEAQPTSQETAS